MTIFLSFVAVTFPITPVFPPVLFTVNSLNIWTPQKIVVITLKSEQDGFSLV